MSDDPKRKALEGPQQANFGRRLGMNLSDVLTNQKVGSTMNAYNQRATNAYNTQVSNDRINRQEERVVAKDQLVAEEQEQAAIEAKDPNSPDNIKARELFATVSPKAFEKLGDRAATLTADDLERISPKLSKMIDREDKKIAKELDRKHKLEDNAYARQTKLMDAKAKQKASGVKPAKPPTNPQFEAASFGRRMEQAEAVFSQLAAEGYDRSDVSAGVGSKLPNVLRSDQGVQQDQAERNFVNAVLRPESGAAISDTEFESAALQYFPRAGDGKETLAHKAANRAQKLEGMKAVAGPAWDQVELQKSAPVGQEAPVAPSGPQTVSFGGDTYATDPIAEKYANIQPTDIDNLTDDELAEYINR